MKRIKIFNVWGNHAFTKTFRIMRISLIILIATVLQTFANDSYSQKTKLSLNYQGTALVDVLDEIENQSEFFFLYNEKLVDVNRKVFLTAKDRKLMKYLQNFSKELKWFTRFPTGKSYLHPSTFLMLRKKQFQEK
jgi:TonB-dependent starch-binding outer membrane protein SusC